MKHNYVDGFRFSDQYEDVFIEDDHYLYACAEPFNWAHYLTVNSYRKLDNGSFLREDTAGADTQYLDTLIKAPVDIAEQIIRMEDARTNAILSQLGA